MKKTILFSLGLLLSCSLFAQKIKVETGKTYNGKTEMKMDIDMGMMQIPMEMETKSEVKITDITGTVANAQITVTHIKAKGSAMGQDFTFDSDKKEDMEGQLGAQFGKMVGKTVNASFDLNTGIGEVKKDADAEGDDDMNSQGGSLLMNNAATGGIAFVLPDNAKLGSKWTVAVKQDVLAGASNFEVTKVEGNLYTVAYTGAAKGSKENADVNATGSGTFVVNKETSLVKTNAFVANVVTNAEMQGQAMEIKINMKGETKY